MVRRHRLMETFLVRELGYSWDEVHDEAEILEHAVSDRMLDRIDAKLGYPTRDPHGDPIPAADGQVPTPPARQLSVCEDGDAGTVARISDADPEMLRYFDSVGISLDSRLRVLARRDFAGMISVAIKSADAKENDPVPPSIWEVLQQKRFGSSASSHDLRLRRCSLGHRDCNGGEVVRVDPTTSAISTLYVRLRRYSFGACPNHRENAWLNAAVSA